MWVQFVQVKRPDFAVTSAMISSATVCGAHFKEKDYLPITGVRIYYSLLLLETAVGLYNSHSDSRLKSWQHRSTIAKAVAAHVGCQMPC